MPGEPTFAATAPITGAQSLPDFCHVDNVALEPPAPTTEITRVAPPTRSANHGAAARGSVFAGAATAAGRCTEELVATDDLVTLLTDVVVGTALEESLVAPAVVGSTEVVRGASDTPAGEACGDPLADTTTSAATATAAATGHRTRTASGTFARRWNISLSLHQPMRRISRTTLSPQAAFIGAVQT